MKKHILILFLLLSVIGYSQNGINYKALIKDASGNAVDNTTVQIQFTIIQDVTNVYTETHAPTTDANGIVIVNIGEGTTISGDFNTINWATTNHFLNVQIDTGTGFIDIGTIPFMSVPYAKHAETAVNATNVNGLEAIDESNGIGWRLIGVNPDGYGNIGLNAVDLSHTTNSENTGALGQSSFSSGFRSTASGSASTAIGNNTEASGISSTAMGFATEASGNYSIATGHNTIAQSSYQTAIGIYNAPSGDPIIWNENDPLFQIGKGISNATRSNALTVFKSGQHNINSNSIGLSINAETTGLSIFNSTIGILMNRTDANGIQITNAGSYGGVFTGNLGGVFSRATTPQGPDVVLGGTANFNEEDDGIIASDSAYPSSDIYLRSYDAVVVQLDYDNNEAGNFRIRNGNQDVVFDVNESGVVRADGVVVHSSDKRLKRDIETIAYGLDEILRLKPKQYFWKNRDNQKLKSLGLIAQDVQPIIQNIVLKGDDDIKTLGVSYTELIPVLIKAIQEQQKIIDNQNIKIEGLTSELIEMKSISTRIKALEQQLKIIEQ